MLIKRIPLTSMKQAMPVLIDQGVGSLSFFLLGAILARAVDKESFSIYLLANTVILILLGFQRALITTPFAIIFPRKLESGNEEYFGNILVLHLVFVCILIIIFFGYAITPLQIIGGNELMTVLVVLAATIGHSFYSFLKFTYLAKLKNIRNMWLGLLANPLLVVIAYGLYMHNHLTVYAAFLIVGVSYLLVSSIFWILLIKESGLMTKGIVGSLRAHWQLGKWVAGSNIAFMLSSQIFPWLLLLFSTREHVAEFGVVMGAARLLAPLAQGLSSFLLPKFAHTCNDKRKFRDSLLVSVGSMAAFAFILAAIGLFFGEEIVVLLYSERYSGLGDLVFIAFLLQGINFVNVPVDSALNALARTDIGFRSLVLSAFVAITGGVLFTWKFDVLGACIGVLLAGFIGVLYRVVVLKKIMEEAMYEDRVRYS